MNMRERAEKYYEEYPISESETNFTAESIMIGFAKKEIELAMSSMKNERKLDGYKDDKNKNASLFPFEVWRDMQREIPDSEWSAILKKRHNVLVDVEQVLDYGLEKYGKRDSWQLVNDGYNRYQNAMMRHETKDGVDEESKLLHYKHSSCNMVFLAWFQLKDQK